MAFHLFVPKFSLLDLSDHCLVSVLGDRRGGGEGRGEDIDREVEDRQ